MEFLIILIAIVVFHRVWKTFKRDLVNLGNRKCRNCNEGIDPTAIRCPHCGVFTRRGNTLWNQIRP